MLMKTFCWASLLQLLVCLPNPNVTGFSVVETKRQRFPLQVLGAGIHKKNFSIAPKPIRHNASADDHHPTQNGQRQIWQLPRALFHKARLALAKPAAFLTKPWTFRRLGRLFLVFWVVCLVQLAFLVPMSEATSASATGLLSQSVDLPQLLVLPEKAIAATTATALEAASKLMVKASAMPQSIKILTLTGSVLLSFAGGVLILGNKRKTSPDEPSLSPSEEAAEAAQREKEEWEVFMSSADVNGVRTDFDAVREKEREADSKLAQARALLSDIEYSVGKPSEDIASYTKSYGNDDDDSGGSEIAATNTSSTVLMDNSPAGGEQNEEQAQMAIENMLASVEQVKLKAKDFQVRKEDMLQDLNTTRNLVTEDPPVKLPPTLEETEFAMWEDAMKDYESYKEMEEHMFYANENSKNKAAVRGDSYLDSLSKLSDGSALQKAFDKMQMPNMTAFQQKVKLPNVTALQNIELKSPIKVQSGGNASTNYPPYKGYTTPPSPKMPLVPTVEQVSPAESKTKQGRATKTATTPTKFVPTPPKTPPGDLLPATMAQTAPIFEMEFETKKDDLPVPPKAEL